MDGTRSIKVAIADDHPIIRKGVRHLLEELPNVFVVGEAGDGKAALELVRQEAPDILILDIQMPVMDGVDVIQQLTRLGMNIVIVVLSGIDDSMFIKEILSMGACEYVIKGDIHSIHHVIREVASGKCRKGQQNLSIKNGAQVY